MAPTGGSNESMAEKGLVVVLFYRTEDVAPAKFIWLLVLFCLLHVTALTLNSTICYVMVRSKCLKKNLSNVFIFHLSIADLIFRLFAAPLEVVSSLPSTKDGTLLCKASNFVSSTCSTAVFMSLVVIASDRHDKLVNPMKNLKTDRKVRAPLLAVWLYSAICSVSFLFTIESRYITELPEATGWKFSDCGNCSVVRVCDLPRDFAGQISSTLYFVLAFVAPLAAITVLYAKIVASLEHRRRQVNCAKTAMQSKRKATRMMLLVLAGFVLTWGPGIILRMLRSYGLFRDMHFEQILTLYMLAETARFFSSLVNPLIYAYYSPQFRQHFISLCSCLSRAARSGESSGQATQSLEMQRTWLTWHEITLAIISRRKFCDHAITALTLFRTLQKTLNARMRSPKIRAQFFKAWTLSFPRSKSYIFPAFSREMYKWGSENW